MLTWVAVGFGERKETQMLAAKLGVRPRNRWVWAAKILKCQQLSWVSSTRPLGLGSENSQMSAVEWSDFTPEAARRSRMLEMCPNNHHELGTKSDNLSVDGRKNEAKATLL